MKSFLNYLWLLVLGWWGAFGLALNVISTIAFIVSFIVAGFEPTRWPAAGTLIISFLISGFRIHQSQEERVVRLQEQIGELEKPAFAEDIRQLAQEGWDKLGREWKDAIRLLCLRGEQTDGQALRHLQNKGMCGGWASVYQQLALDFGFVERVVAERQHDEHIRGYTGPYRLNPRFKEALEKIVQSSRS